MKGVGYDKIRKLFFAGNPQHGLAKVGTNKKRLGTGSGDHSCELPAARCQIEYSCWIPSTHDGRGSQAPEHVDSETQNRVR
jgi:hypothetical protein